MESSTKFCKIKLMTDHLIWDEVVPQTKQVLNGYSGSEDTLVEGERIEKSRALTTFGKVPSILFTKRERESIHHTDGIRGNSVLHSSAIMLLD